jgi:hypothetical protein
VLKNKIWAEKKSNGPEELVMSSDM